MSTEMAKLMGQGDDTDRPGTSATLRKDSDPLTSISSAFGKLPGSVSEDDLAADDPLTNPLGMIGSSSSRSLASEHTSIVVPAITIRSEYPSISRVHRKGKQAITAIITVDVPAAGDRGRYPAVPRPRNFPISRTISGDESQLPPSPRSTASHPTDMLPLLPVPPSARLMPSPSGPDPFAHVLTDLQKRVVNYSTSGLDFLGSLRLFDLLYVRKATMIRDFNVYLFQDAIICIQEEKKSAMRKIFSSSASIRSNESSHSPNPRRAMKMKGRIYIKHVQSIRDTSVPGELSLTIEMSDPAVESFILVFKDRGSQETWKRTLNATLDDAKDQPHDPQRAESAAKVAKLMGAGAPTPRSVNTSSSKGFFSPISTTAANTGSLNGRSYGDFIPGSAVSGQTQMSTATTSLTSITSPPTAVSKDDGLGDLAHIAPLAPVHTPMDLVVILSLPAPVVGRADSQIPLKTRLMRQSLQFVLALMGSRDRISLVATEMGPNGVVRKTPFLNTTRPDSRRRLESFVDLLGQGKVDGDELAVAVGRDEKRDVVAAVNTALDVVLQRKVRNPLSGMILISDTSESIKRAQMELVTARLDAANLPVHALGYGKGHDPSPLWMISNHTNGTYTFIKEWYHLREVLAGVIGGMMSVAVTNMKLHVNCQDNEFMVVKVSGANQAIVSTGGRYADVELKELRHGEVRELMVELDFAQPSEDGRETTEGRYSGDGSEDSNPNAIAANGHQFPGPPSARGSSVHKSPSLGSAQNHLVNRASSAGLSGVMSLNGVNGNGIGTLGMEGLSVNDTNAMIYEDGLIDELPVTEVDCSFHDPAAGRTVTRLAHPILLTTAILPSTAPPSSSSPDSMVVRRRMELLASDMITRALLIASRKNYSHAVKILRETKNIVDKIAEGLHAGLLYANGGGMGRTRRDIQNAKALEGLTAIANDLDVLVDGLEEHQEMFERDMRNFAAQQVSDSMMIFKGKVD